MFDARPAYLATNVNTVYGKVCKRPSNGIGRNLIFTIETYSSRDTSSTARAELRRRGQRGLTDSTNQRKLGRRRRRIDSRRSAITALLRGRALQETPRTRYAKTITICNSSNRKHQGPGSEESNITSITSR